MDETFWKEPIVKEYAPIPPLTSADSPLKALGVRAIRLLQEQDFYTALETFRDPSQGFFELEESGLHLLGFTRDGTVFMDNSGQTKPGMDIGTILGVQGEPILPRFLQAATDPNGGLLTLPEVWPNPVTQVVSPLSAWCGLLTQNDVICVLAWATGKDR